MVAHTVARAEKDVLAGALIPELVHGQAEADEYKTPDIKPELD
jgi:hypothetical protein